MSKGRNSSYPERPARPAPKKPGKGKGRPSSEHISGKRKGRLVKAVAVDASPAKRESVDKLAFSIAGHNPDGRLTAFLKEHIFNRVPLHKWGTKGRTESA